MCGLNFSDEPLQLGEMYCLEISGRTDITDWSGALRLGVTAEVRRVFYPNLRLSFSLADAQRHKKKLKHSQMEQG